MVPENWHVWVILMVIAVIYYYDSCVSRRIVENAEGEPEPKIHGAADDDLIRAFANNLQTSSALIVPVASIPKSSLPPTASDRARLATSKPKKEKGWFDDLFGDDEEDGVEEVEIKPETDVMKKPKKEKSWFDELFGDDEEEFSGSRADGGDNILLVNGTSHPKFSRYMGDLRLGDVVNLLKATGNPKFRQEFPLGHITMTYHSCHDTNNDNVIDHNFECSVGKFKYLGGYRWELVETSKRQILHDEYSGLIKATGSRSPKKNKEEFGCLPCRSRNSTDTKGLIEKRDQLSDAIYNLRDKLASTSSLGKMQIVHSIQMLSTQKAQIDSQLKKAGIESFRTASENDIPPLVGMTIRERIPTYTKNGGLFIPQPGKSSGGKVIRNNLSPRRTWDLFPGSEFGSRKKVERRQCPFSKDGTFDYKCGQLWHGATWNIPRTWTFDDGSSYEFDGRMITELHA